MLLYPQPVAPYTVPPAPAEYVDDDNDSDADEVNIHEILFGSAVTASAKGWASEHQAQYTFVGGTGVPAAPRRTFMQYSPQQQPFMPPSNALFMRAPFAPEPVPPVAPVEAKEQAAPPTEQAAPPAEGPANPKAGSGEKPRRRLRSHEFHCYGRANTRPSTGGFVFGDYMTTHNARVGAHLPIRRRSPNSEANSDGAQIHLMERDRRTSLAPGGLARSQAARSTPRAAPKSFDFFEAQAPAPLPAPPTAPPTAPTTATPTATPTAAALARDMYATLPAYDPRAYVAAPPAPHAPQPPQVQMQWAPQWTPPASAPPAPQLAWLPSDMAQQQQAYAQMMQQQQQAQQQQAQQQQAQQQWQWQTQQWQQQQQQQQQQQMAAYMAPYMAPYMAATAAPPPAPPLPFAPDEPGVRNAPSNYKDVPGLMRSVPPAGTRSKRRDNISK